ncbi:MAG: uracil phosphoribosyltransferase [Minisyncoccia bacterium]|jgi:uracil phosphoribosyltransferase
MQTVESVLRESRQRIGERRSLVDNMSAKELRSRMAQLRTVMFGRRRSREAFHPLDDEELAILERTVRGYVVSGQLFVGGELFMDGFYATIRHNLLCGDRSVGPEKFRHASRAITEQIMLWCGGRIGYDIWDSGTTVMMPWRAGLAFADAAHELGLSSFYHYGAKRNEETLETEKYFEEVPESLLDLPEKKTVLLTDPMLATGNTDLSALRRLGDLGVPQKRTFIIAVISAPEGIDQILQAYPDVRIFVGKNDECLNEDGYIVPGLGDYGDKYFEGLGREKVAEWRDGGVLNARAEKALLARMAKG